MLCTIFRGTHILPPATDKRRATLHLVGRRSSFSTYIAQLLQSVLVTGHTQTTIRDTILSIIHFLCGAGPCDRCNRAIDNKASWKLERPLHALLGSPSVRAADPCESYGIPAKQIGANDCSSGHREITSPLKVHSSVPLRHCPCLAGQRGPNSSIAPSPQAPTAALLARRGAS